MAILVELLAFVMVSAGVIVVCLTIEALCDLLSPWDAIAHSDRLGMAQRLPVPHIA
jgi:hypothetical protein